MSTEAEAIEKGASWLSALMSSAETALNVLKNTHDFNQSIRDAIRTFKQQRTGQVPFGGKDGLAQNNNVGFLYVNDSKTTAETKKMNKEFQKDLSKAGVTWSKTKMSEKADGVPSSYAFKAEDIKKVETIMQDPKYKGKIAFNPTPTLDDFDDKDVSREDALSWTEKNKQKGKDGQTANKDQTKSQKKQEEQEGKKNQNGMFRGGIRNHVDKDQQSEKEAARKAKDISTKTHKGPKGPGAR